MYKSFSRRFSLLIRSLRRLEIASTLFSGAKRIYLLKNVPIFNAFILQKHILDTVYRSIIPFPFNCSYHASIPLPDFHSFDLPTPNTKSPGKSQSSYLVIQGSSTKEIPGLFHLSCWRWNLYIYGSKSEDFQVGATIYSPELGLALKHKLPSDTSIFSAEAWAFILVESSQFKKATIFSDSRSVLDALSSSHKKSNTNYLIPTY